MYIQFITNFYPYIPVSYCLYIYSYIPIDITLQYAPFPVPTVVVISLWTGKCLIKYHSFLYKIRNVRNLYGCPY